MAPNTVKVRLITGNDILDNPVVFIPIMILWFFFLCLLAWSHKAGKEAEALPDKPYQVDRDDALMDVHEPLHYLRLSIKTGTRPFAGLTSANEVTVELMDDSGREDTIELTGDMARRLARNTKSVWLFSTPLALANITELALRVVGVDNAWYVSFAVISDMSEAESALQMIRDKHVDPFEMDKRARFFWINEWVDIYKDTIAHAQSFEDFNDKGSLFKHHIAESFTNNHFIASIFLAPPRSSFTPPQRVAVCMLLLCAIIFANAFFYKGDQPMTFASTMYIGFISSLIVTPPTGGVVGAFRWGGRGGKLFSKKWFVRWSAWFVAVGGSAWCSYYVLLLSFAWGRDKSWQWLTSCGTSFAISTLVTDVIIIATMAAVAAYLDQIDDIATVDELAQQRMAGKLAAIEKAEGYAADGMHLEDVFDDHHSDFEERPQSPAGRRWSQIRENVHSASANNARVKQVVSLVGEAAKNEMRGRGLAALVGKAKTDVAPSSGLAALVGKVDKTAPPSNGFAASKGKTQTESLVRVLL